MSRTRPGRSTITMSIDKLPASGGQRLTSAQLIGAQFQQARAAALRSDRRRARQGRRCLARLEAWTDVLAPGAPRWRLFHSRRWLPDDQIQDLAISGDGDSVWCARRRESRGCRQIETTLDAKMAQIEAELRKRHVRHGLVGGIDARGSRQARRRLRAALQRQRRPVDQHVRRRRGLSLRRRRATEQAKKNARRLARSAHVSGARHRHSGLRRPQHRPDRRRRQAVWRRVASLGRRQVVVEGRHVERRARRPLLRLCGVLRRGRRRDGEGRDPPVRRANHRPHSRPRAVLRRSAGQADDLGRVGAGEAEPRSGMARRPGSQLARRFCRT